MSTWQRDAPLFAAWQRFVAADVAPFTIPGHKRRADTVSADLGRLLDADVPLFGGLDEVRLTHGVLAEAERRAAAYWDARWLRFSTGGSTHANQVLTLAVGRPGDTVLVARTAHRSTLSGLVLAGLRPVWLPTAVDPATGVPVGVPAEVVAAAVREHPSAAGAFLVEPSYLGTVSDLESIVAVCHDAGMPVLVDQAWGAHFGAHPAVPAGALDRGADAVVFSAHKALPAFSQAAVVATRGDRLDPDRLERAFEASHTTSPAGAVLASTDAARALLQHDGRPLLTALIEAVADVRHRLAAVGVHTADVDDPLKLVLLLAPSGHDGRAVERGLIDRGLPVEQADRDTVVPAVGLLDDTSTLDRLARALLDLLGAAGTPRPVVPAVSWAQDVPPQALTPREAFFAAHRTVPFAAAEGEVSAELVAPYPPGVPVVAPGEVLTAAVLAALQRAAASGVRVAYAADPTLATLQVVAARPVRSSPRG